MEAGGENVRDHSSNEIYETREIKHSFLKENPKKNNASCVVANEFSTASTQATSMTYPTSETINKITKKERTAPFTFNPSMIPNRLEKIITVILLPILLLIIIHPTHLQLSTRIRASRTTGRTLRPRRRRRRRHRRCCFPIIAHRPEEVYSVHWQRPSPSLNVAVHHHNVSPCSTRTTKTTRSRTACRRRRSRSEASARACRSTRWRRQRRRHRWRRGSTKQSESRPSGRGRHPSQLERLLRVSQQVDLGWGDHDGGFESHDVRDWTGRFGWELVFGGEAYAVCAHVSFGVGNYGECPCASWVCTGEC